MGKIRKKDRQWVVFENILFNLNFASPNKLISQKFPDSKLLIIIGAGHKEKMKKFVSKLINTNQ